MNERLKIFTNFLIVNLIVRSQAEFASVIGVAKSQFSEIINGKRNISDKLVNRIHELYPNLNIEWLKEGKGHMLNNTSPQINNIGEFTNTGDINNTINMEQPEAKDYLAVTQHMLTQVGRILDQADRILTIIEKKL